MHDPDVLAARATRLLRDPPRPDLGPMALALFQRAIQAAPTRVDLRLHLALAQHELLQEADAQATCRAALALDPHAVEARLLHATFHVPSIHRSAGTVVSSGARFQDEVEALDADMGDDPAAARRLAPWLVRAYPYYLPYRGLNDVAPMRAFGALACRTMALAHPDLASQAAPRALPPGERLRVGIVSRHFFAHSNWRAILHGWLVALDPARFDVHAYCLGSREDACTAEARRLAGHFVAGERSLEDWARTIAGDRLDVLLYPAVGDLSLVTALAMLRLAPVQALAAGHTTTSGFPTIDYFLSSDLAEPADAAAHYSERLVRLPGLGFGYQRPVVADSPRDRASFGLRAGACVFLATNALFKCLPQHDDLYPRIAAEAGDCQFVFADLPRYPMARVAMEQRLGAAFAARGLDPARHVVFLPRQSRDDYSRLLQLGDVFLDAIPWTGGVTGTVVLGHDLPLVTVPGPVFRGRMGAAMLCRIGLEDMIARDLDDYVALAVRLARTPDLRHALRARIAAGKHRIFDDPEVPAAFAAFLETAARPA
ncbi:O-linked N-acetylglucosamine transferase family protein [Zavarzinia sp. CC-PAN008]|uniref:O-linked N-acetylglucosamine transferase, SPINDLY family protein n=1 Tax=Zavarzinia sp. CC-PAN008 TaxID=3243332 RepID=UPI003F74721A